MKIPVIGAIYLGLMFLSSSYVAAELEVNSTGITIDSGNSTSYLNFDTTDGSSGFGLRDNSGNLEYKADLSKNWLKFNDLGVWKQNGSYIFPAGEETSSSPDVWVTIGNQTPETLLHIYDFTTDNSGQEDHRPQVNIYQDGAGDASQTFRLQFNGGNRQHFTLGIDQHFSNSAAQDSTDFKICHEAYEELGGTVPSTLGYLKGEVYTAPALMLRIHGTDWPDTGPTQSSSGIIDFNHQSRARYYSLTPGLNLAMPDSWTPVHFDSPVDGINSWDEHSEMTVASDGPISFSRFIAKEEGYYQVNARIEFSLPKLQPPEPVPGFEDSYVSIAIYHYNLSGSSSPYSEGNKLQIINGNLFNLALLLLDPPLEPNPGYLLHNNAPNVSDIIYLKKDEGIEIRMFQNTGSPIELNVLSPADSHKNYVSIHKIS